MFRSQLSYVRVCIFMVGFFFLSFSAFVALPLDVMNQASAFCKSFHGLLPLLQSSLISTTKACKAFACSKLMWTVEVPVATHTSTLRLDWVFSYPITCWCNVTSQTSIYVYPSFRNEEKSILQKVKACPHWTSSS